ncbi:MAG TPA: hypothetical protein V6C63_12830 [Allocoleopsis sp.]
MTQAIDYIPTCATCPFGRQIEGDRYTCSAAHNQHSQAVKGYWQATADCDEAIELYHQANERIMSDVIHQSAVEEFEAEVLNDDSWLTEPITQCQPIEPNRPYIEFKQISQKVGYQVKYDNSIVCGYRGFQSKNRAQEWADALNLKTQVREAKHLKDCAYEVKIWGCSFAQLQEWAYPQPTSKAAQVFGYGDYMGASRLNRIRNEAIGIDPSDLIADMKAVRPKEATFNPAEYNPILNGRYSDRY